MKNFWKKVLYTSVSVLALWTAARDVNAAPKHAFLPAAQEIASPAVRQKYVSVQGSVRNAFFNELVDAQIEGSAAAAAVKAFERAQVRFTRLQDKAPFCVVIAKTPQGDRFVAARLNDHGRDVIVGDRDVLAQAEKEASAAPASDRATLPALDGVLANIARFDPSLWALRQTQREDVGAQKAVPAPREIAPLETRDYKLGEGQGLAQFLLSRKVGIVSKHDVAMAVKAIEALMRQQKVGFVPEAMRAGMVLSVTHRQGVLQGFAFNAPPENKVRLIVERRPDGRYKARVDATGFQKRFELVHGTVTSGFFADAKTAGLRATDLTQIQMRLGGSRGVLDRLPKGMPFFCLLERRYDPDGRFIASHPLQARLGAKAYTFLHYKGLTDYAYDEEGQIQGTFFTAPVQGRVNSSWGWRHDPFTGALKFHHGIDIKAEEGAPVHAMADGVVTWVGSHSEGGNIVEINYGGFTSRFLHLKDKSALVRQGDKVQQGQVVAAVGNTGRSTGSHLHVKVVLSSRKGQAGFYEVQGLSEGMEVDPSLVFLVRPNLSGPPLEALRAQKNQADRLIATLLEEERLKKDDAYQTVLLTERYLAAFGVRKEPQPQTNAIADALKAVGFDLAPSCLGTPQERFHAVMAPLLGSSQAAANEASDRKAYQETSERAQLEARLRAAKDYRARVDAFFDLHDYKLSRLLPGKAPVAVALNEGNATEASRQLAAGSLAGALGLGGPSEEGERAIQSAIDADTVLQGAPDKQPQRSYGRHAVRRLRPGVPRMGAGSK